MSTGASSDNQPAIVITGSAGFIGSCLVQFLNERGYHNLVLVDDFSIASKRQNWAEKTYAHLIDRDELFNWLAAYNAPISFVLHIGARTDTTEFNYAVHQKLNVDYSQAVWHYCVSNNIPLVYASSAATYGAGEFGYSDQHEMVDQLKPLNPYGVSKNEFDKWALNQHHAPPCWAGLKFFNVYGPNEYHKGRMASVVWHSFKQIKQDGFVKLFKSHRSDYDNGEQLRDFVYVKDILKIIFWMIEQMTEKLWVPYQNGLYNIGTGEARSFNALVSASFKALDKQSKISFIDMPNDIRDKYQYFTQADMSKLTGIGYEEPFYTLEEGVDDYVRNYLAPGRFY